VTIHRPYQSLAGEGGRIVRLTPEDAGWHRTGLEVVRVEAGLQVTVSTGDSECE
jgi:5-deoxy-D-glucuronate isomerase